MIDRDHITAALDTIAMKFEQQYQRDESNEDWGGWGQFLDGPRPHRQIGLYGTSAGLLVLSLAERDDTVCTVGATNLLSNWWKERANGYGRIKFPQVPRLAFFALTLRNTPNEIARTIAGEVEEELLARVSSNGRWGDYWLNKNVRDGSFRYLSSALAALSLSTLTSPSQKVLPCLAKTSEFLERTLATNRHLTPTERGLITAAIVSSLGSIQNRKAAKVMRAQAREPIGTLSQNYSYFYEYQYANPESLSVLWNRDLVFLYSEIMLGIAGFLPNAPAELRLRAEGILGRVLDNIAAEGSFRPIHEGRLSTVEQAWCAVLLALARNQAPRKSGTLGRFRYQLLRQWEPTSFTDIVFPVTAMTIVAAISAIPLEFMPFTFAKVLAALIIFGLYGEKVIRRIVPGK